MKANLKNELMAEVEAAICLKFKAQESRGRALFHFRTEVDEYRGVELDGLSVPALRKFFYQIAGKAVARELAEEDIDSEPVASTANPSLLDEAKREINALPVPKDWKGSAQEWRAAALAGVRRLLECTPPKGTKPEWKPGSELTTEQRVRYQSSVLTDKPTRFHPKRKTEVVNKLLAGSVRASDETKWMERELMANKRIAWDALRAKAPPGYFEGMGVPEFQVKIARHRKKLGINK